MGLVLPHAVTFVVNVTYHITSGTGTVTTDASFSGVLVSAVETDDGSVIDPVHWYTFTMGELSGPSDIPANATTGSLG